MQTVKLQELRIGDVVTFNSTYGPFSPMILQAIDRHNNSTTRYVFQRPYATVHCRRDSDTGSSARMSYTAEPVYIDASCTKDYYLHTNVHHE